MCKRQELVVCRIPDWAPISLNGAMAHKVPVEPRDFRIRRHELQDCQRALLKRSEVTSLPHRWIPRKRFLNLFKMQLKLNDECYSEFPSLSGGSQPQVQNHNQAFWSGQRQHTPVQRSQPNRTGSQQSSSQDHAHQSLDDAFFPSVGGNSLDDYRHGGQNGVGQLASSSQPQPSSIDDFPPLGGNGPGEIGQDRRVNMMQNAANSAFGSSSGFPPGANS